MAPLHIPIDSLNPETLDGLVEEFVTRDGTDYGVLERTLAEKKSAILRQLQRGEIVIVFDSESETCNIIPKDDVRSGGRSG